MCTTLRTCLLFSFNNVLIVKDIHKLKPMLKVNNYLYYKDKCSKAQTNAQNEERSCQVD